MAMILSCGVVTVLAPIIEGLPSQSGLLVASPMIVSSIAALCVTGLNGFSQRTRGVIHKQPPTIRERVFAGLAAAGGGLVGIGVFFYFAPIFPKQMVVITALAIGVPLLVAAFLVRRTPKTNMVTMQ